MNIEVLLLFVNATLSMVLAAVIIVVILRREYLPVIRDLETAGRQQRLVSDDLVSDDLVSDDLVSNGRVEHPKNRGE